MKKIINGKKYDTDTAEAITEYESDYPRNDFRWYAETLYRKRTGEFFLGGEGNAMSKYAERCYDGWGSGEGITPISVSEAKEWLETCSDADTYEKVFGEVAEDDSKKIVSLSITQEASDLLARLAQDMGESRSAIVDRLIKKEAGK